MGWQDDQVLTNKPKWESDPIITSDSSVSAPMIDIREGVSVPELLVPSKNPYSAGLYPLGRKFSTGDEAVFRVTDPFSHVEIEMRKWRVTHVDADADRVEINNGVLVFDLMGNVRGTQNASMDVPQQVFPAELFVGKKWVAGWKSRSADGVTKIVNYELNVAAFEKVRVIAGEFQAFRIEGKGMVIDYGAKLQNRNKRKTLQLWVVPGINFFLKRNVITFKMKGFGDDTESAELVSLRQQTVDYDVGMHLNFVINNSCA